MISNNTANSFRLQRYSEKTTEAFESNFLDEYSKPHLRQSAWKWKWKALRAKLRHHSRILVRLLSALFVLIAFTAVFRPSYTHLPQHYEALHSRIKVSATPGRANLANEKIFISISLYDGNGHLASGAFGRAILSLIDLLGPENTFVSIYENDSGYKGVAALEALEQELPCEHEVVVDAHVDKAIFPTVELPNGEARLKRLTYLSEMRNRALRPLDRGIGAQGTQWDKVLILNDVIFNPEDAAQLLFSTRMGENGKTDYLAACAMDFINPFKFYDVYATRDLDGFSMGIPIFPVFSSAGSASSRSDMLAQKDAVRVRGCWSGMVAFDAQYLQAAKPVTRTKTREVLSESTNKQNIDFWTIDPATTQAPSHQSLVARFRPEPEVFFDACECCLIMADIIQLADRSADYVDAGVYMNPYVRVAYDSGTLSWLPLVRRLERLFSWPHALINSLAGLPTFNPHRTVMPGDEFQEEVWVKDTEKPGNGSWQLVDRVARPGMYCGVREMQVLLETKRLRDKNWANMPLPGGRLLGWGI